MCKFTYKKEHKHKSRITLCELIRPMQKMMLNFNVGLLSLRAVIYRFKLSFGKRAIKSVTRLPIYRY